MGLHNRYYQIISISFSLFMIISHIDDIMLGGGWAIVYTGLSIAHFVVILLIGKYLVKQLRCDHQFQYYQHTSSTNFKWETFKYQCPKCNREKRVKIRGIDITKLHFLRQSVMYRYLLTAINSETADFIITNPNSSVIKK